MVRALCRRCRPNDGCKRGSLSVRSRPRRNRGRDPMRREVRRLYTVSEWSFEPSTEGRPSGIRLAACESPMKILRVTAVRRERSTAATSLHSTTPRSSSIQSLCLRAGFLDLSESEVVSLRKYIAKVDFPSRRFRGRLRVEQLRSAHAEMLPKSYCAARHLASDL